ncbi:MAG: C39 family peptidase [Candidatus Aegiribacteria sp.]|nr:C39 family peptidase [Candidatus Aegiribacteria sp.]
MLVLLILASLIAPLNPALTEIALKDTPEGLLLTDGRHRGLFLQNRYDEIEVISDEPGAGRNVILIEGYVLFKECPSGIPQRVIAITPDRAERTLYESECFSGPFIKASSTFMIAHDGFLIEYDLRGREIIRWYIGEFPAWAAAANDRICFTGETGGLRILTMETGEILSIRIPGVEEITYSRISSGPGGLFLAEKSSGGFTVLDSTGNVITDNSCYYYPSWTEDGNILCSCLVFSGMFLTSGDILSIDPRTGDQEIIPVSGIPLNPVSTRDSEIVWTDGASGKLIGFNVRSFPALEYQPVTDDPEGYIDVPYMHQRWDTPDWFDGSWSCGPTSCVMAVQYYRMLTPDSIWASYPSKGHWSLWGNYIPEEYTFLDYTYDELGESPGGVMVPGAHGFICPNGSAWWNNMVDYLNQHEVNSAWAGTSWSTLTEQIDSSYPVVCSSSLGSGHIIILSGYYTNHTIIVNDPYGDANESGWGNYYNGKDVLYDWPGYNNGHVEIGISQLFYAQAQVSTEPDTLVDDCCKGFEKYGDCRYWHLTGDGYEGNAWWTWSTGALPDTCIAQWHPELPGTGDYIVSVYIPPYYATATGIYVIQTSSGPVEATLDQGLYSGEWAVLDTFHLSDDAWLKLGDYTGTGGQYIAFDAALFSLPETGISDDFFSDNTGFSLFPNPCRETAYVILPSGNDGATISLYDTSGRLISRTSISNCQSTVQIDVSSLSSGLYLLKVSIDGYSNWTFSRLMTVCR